MQGAMTIVEVFGQVHRYEYNSRYTFCSGAVCNTLRILVKGGIPMY